MVFGDRWYYEGTAEENIHIVEREITRLDQASFPSDTYVFEIKVNGVDQPSEWYEKKAGEVRLWAGGGYSFSEGLLAAWYPMQVGDQAMTTANVVGYSGISVQLTVDVLSEEPITLPFDTFEAYELKYQLLFSGPGGTISETFRWWIVPYIGVVKEQRANSVGQLISFGIGGNTITENSDFDSDGLKDYQEVIIHKTNMLEADTDSDGMPDGWEIIYVLDPLDGNDASGDSDKDGYTNLEEYRQATDPNDPESHPFKGIPWILLLLDD